MGPPRLVSRLPPLVPAGLLLALGGGALAWLARNPFADGCQNEYLHVGNAFDLWTALVHRDTWHLHYYLTHNYWPPGFYLAPWPLLGLLGMGRLALVATNLGWLALALLATWKLAGGRWPGVAATVLLAACPATWGALVRYEPNLAQTACLGLALWALAESRGLTRLRPTLAAAAATALGLLTDRLGTAPFLVVPLLVATLDGRSALARGGVGLAARWRLPAAFATVLLLLAGPWYTAWLQSQLPEVIAQLTTGEVDSAGDLTQGPPLLSVAGLLYYPLTLLDSQAGPLLGGALLLGLLVPGSGAAATQPCRLAVLSGWALFTLISKKQPFYTMPLVLPLAVVAVDALSRARALRTSALLILAAAGLHQYAGRAWDGAWPILPRLARPDPLPAAWVDPRYPLASPPSDQDVPLEAWCEALASGGGPALLFSEDPTLFEGFLVLVFRECRPDLPLRALRQDPVGTYEWVRRSRSFLVLGAPGFPGAERVTRALVDDHYRLEDLPPLIEVLEAEAAAWSVEQTWSMANGATATLWRRTP